MKMMLLNQKGNLAIALVLSVLGMMSGFTIASMAMRDTMSAQYGYEAIQGLHMVRSESTRGLAVATKKGDIGGSMLLVPRAIVVESSNMKKTFKIRSRVTEDQVLTEYGGFRTGGYTVRSLATAARGKGNLVIGNRNDSIVRKYGEFTLRKRSFSEFHYFTDNEESTNGTPVYFWGPDEIRGRVHSNTDIWLKNGGGGINQGWPLFHNLVTTAGKIRSTAAQIPYEQIFEGGYLEDYNTYEYPPLANNVRQNATIRLGAEGYKKIFFVTVSGQSYSGWEGNIIDKRDTANVYTRYPPLPDQSLPFPPLFRNTWAGVDTAWSPMPAGTNSRSIFCYNKLWLRGSFAGRQTWGSADTLYLAGDILLQSTPAFSPPDNPMNRQDIVGIVSEKSILIQYGYKDPSPEGTRQHPNCGSDADGILIYAALCALGRSDQSHFDGVFSYQYQHPHPSTPAYRIGSVVWSRIDIHRRKYPQVLPTIPWPTLPQNTTHADRPALDYPWYNPLWPERQPFKERGSIWLWGSVAQRRRGFVHRSGNDSEYPSNSGVWNIPIDRCGAPISVTWSDPIYQGGPTLAMAGINAPGASGSGSGYKKKYHFDTRFLYTSPVDFPDVNLRGGTTPLKGESWTLRKPPSTL